MSSVLSRVAIGLGLVCVVAAMALAVEPPVAAKRPVETTLHSDTRVDEYGWLREKSDSEVIAYLEAENGFARAMTEHLAPLREELYQEFVSRLKQTDVTAAWQHGIYRYYTRTREGLDYPIHCRRDEQRVEPETVILDVNELAEGHGYYRLTRWKVSPDNARVAYSYDTTGYEDATLAFRDLGVGSSEPVGEEITGVSPWSLAWGNQNTIFYCRMDDAKRDNRVYRHIIGTDPSLDVLVYEEPDERFSVGVELTRSGELVLITSSSKTTSEVRMVPVSDLEATPKVIRPREDGVRYSVDHQRGEDGGTLFVLTDLDAPEFRVCTAPVAEPGAWTELIPHDPAVFRESLACFAKHYVVQERAGGFRRLVIDRYDRDDLEVIETQDTVGILGMRDNHDYDYRYLRFEEESPVRPTEVREYDLFRKINFVRKQDEVAGFDPELYAVERSYAAAADGERVPVSIVYRKGVERDGSAPGFLYSYGSYGFSSDPWFRQTWLSLLDRGFVCAIAHVRGGSELGRRWKEGGRMEHKMNTFTDFIAVAEHLIAEGWTSADRLAIEGGSAGGLLMGAVVNLRPDLFAAVHAAVPFVDVVNTMLDASIPLTTEEYEEWGNPNEKRWYDVMRAYSPYDNVGAQDYPAMLVTAGLNDPRVHYWEPAKWVARLRDRGTGDAPLLLKTHMGAGHGGSSGRYARFEEKAWQWACLIDWVGAREGVGGGERLED